MTINNNILQVNVISPQAILYSGSAFSVTSKNSAGKFDILPEHANFITIIENSPIEIQKLDKKKVVFKFPLAIILNQDNKVSIYSQFLPPKI